MVIYYILVRELEAPDEDDDNWYDGLAPQIQFRRKHTSSGSSRSTPRYGRSKVSIKSLLPDDTNSALDVIIATIHHLPSDTALALENSGLKLDKQLF